jgi:hypothetical protein
MGELSIPKSNLCEERELWLRPRICRLLLEATKSWPSMDLGFKVHQYIRCRHVANLNLCACNYTMTKLQLYRD